VRVRLSVLSYADFPTAMITALAAGANLPDLMAMDREIVGKLADSAGLHDLRQPPLRRAPPRPRWRRSRSPPAMGAAAR
jgi:multiple sugar transport system substrate-binding protein